MGDKLWYTLLACALFIPKDGFGMIKIWWVAIAALGIADMFFAYCAWSVLRDRQWCHVPGSGFVGVVLLLKREWGSDNA